MSYKRIVLNRIKTPDGTILTSYHVHDYKIYFDSNGQVYMVDGGTFYLRRNIYINYPYEELSVYEDAPFEVIRESLHWGSRGKSGKDDLIWVRLCDMESDHIRSCIVYIKKLDDMYKSFFIQELKYRGEINGIN